MYRVTWRSGILTAVFLLAALAGVACSTEPASEAVPLRLLMTDDWGDRPAFLAAVKEFEQSNPGVRVEIDLLSISDMEDALRSQVRAGNPVDLMQWHAYAAGAQGLAEPLDDLWAEAGMEAGDFFEGAVADVTWAGTRYGVPLDINALVLFYRPDLFARAGLDEPAGEYDFGDLEAYGESLARLEPPRQLIVLASSYWAAYGWVRSNGGELLEVVDGEPHFTLDSPEVVDTLSFLASLVRNGYARPPRGQDSPGDALALFRAGSVAMHASGSWDLSNLDREGRATAYRAALMPRGRTGETRGTVMGGSSMLVPKGAANRELAFELMRTVISTEHALRLAREEGRLPVRPGVYTDPFFEEPALQVVLEQLETARPLLIEAFPEATAAFHEALNAVLQDGQVPRSALEAAQARAEASLEN